MTPKEQEAQILHEAVMSGRRIYYTRYGEARVAAATETYDAWASNANNQLHEIQRHIDYDEPAYLKQFNNLTSKRSK